MHKEFNKIFKKWLKESEPYVLSEVDWNKLIESLKNPPHPSENLTKAMNRFRELSKK